MRAASAVSTASAAGPFRRRTLAVLAAVGGTGLALMLFYMLFGPRSAGVAPLPRSAVGYRAVVRLLQTEMPVQAARGLFPVGAAVDRGILVLDPPPEGYARLGETVVRAAGEGVPVVLVLPKWTAEVDPARPGWAGSVELRPESVVAAALSVAMGQVAPAAETGSPDRDEAHGDAGGTSGDEASADGGPWTGSHLPYEVVRPAAAGPFTGELLDGAATRSPELAPDLPRPQLFRDRAGHFEPLVAAPEGILVARAKDLPLWVVSDPDLLNVAGLSRGDNGVLAHRLLVEWLEVESWYVREGTFGALPPEESVWRGLLRPPLAVVSLHLALVALLVSWVAAERFGRPRVPPPRVPPGKGTLVDNTARLLAAAGDPQEALQRYLNLTARRAAERLGLPPGLEGRERLHRLHRIGQRRGAGSGLREHVIAVESLPARGAARHRRALSVARDLHRWYREVCGTQGRP